MGKTVTRKMLMKRWALLGYVISFGTITFDTNYDGGNAQGELITPALVGMKKLHALFCTNARGYQIQPDYESADADTGIRVRAWKGASEAVDGEDGLENLACYYLAIGS